MDDKPQEEELTEALATITALRKQLHDEQIEASRILDQTKAELMKARAEIDLLKHTTVQP